MSVTVLQLSVFPVSGEPGTVLVSAEVTAAGLVGDRAKKRPVHVISEVDYRDSAPRANIVVTAPPDVVAGWLGQQVQAGEVVLDIVQVPSGCPGVYATVHLGGTVRLGDAVVERDDQTS